MIPFLLFSRALSLAVAIRRLQYKTFSFEMVGSPLDEPSLQFQPGVPFIDRQTKAVLSAGSDLLSVIFQIEDKLSFLEMPKARVEKPYFHPIPDEVDRLFILPFKKLKLEDCFFYFNRFLVTDQPASADCLVSLSLSLADQLLTGTLQRRAPVNWDPWGKFDPTADSSRADLFSFEEDDTFEAHLRRPAAFFDEDPQPEKAHLGLNVLDWGSSLNFRIDKVEGVRLSYFGIVDEVEPSRVVFTACSRKEADVQIYIEKKDGGVVLVVSNMNP